MNYSKTLEEFLKFLRNSCTTNDMALDAKTEYEQQTQDILHDLELEDNSYHECAHLAIATRDIRKARREAKNTIEITNPIVDWMRENQSAYKSLEQLLGDVRKAEKRIEARTYGARTDIIEQIKERQNENNGQGIQDKTV